jgi:hypothetical protein
MACGSSAAKSHDLCTVVFLYTLIYDRVQEKYDDSRPYMEKIRSRTVSVFRRISSYTVIYDTVYDRLRPYTESVTIDLGGI